MSLGGPLFVNRSLSLCALAGALCGLALFLALGPVLFRKKTAPARLALGLLFIYAPMVLVLTLFPQRASAAVLGPFHGNGWPGDVNWVPFAASLRLFRNSIPVFLRNVGGNLLLLMPLGFLLGMLGRVRFPTALAAGLLVSLGIEGLQLAENLFFGAQLHVVDVDDLIFNVIGCAAGYGIYAAARALVRPLFPAAGGEPG